MFNSITRLFGKNHRKGTIHPAYFEALEARQLLSASTYQVSDFYGTTWRVVGQGYSGSFSIGSAANDITGTITRDDGSTFNLDNASFTITDSGDQGGKGIFTLSQSNPADTANYIEINGRLSSTDSFLVGGDVKGSAQTALIQDTSNNFETDNDSELIGSWNISGKESKGSFTIGYRNGALAITSGSLIIDGQRIGFSTTQSTVTLDATTGAVLITLKNAAGAAVRTYSGYLDDTGTFLALNNTAADDGNDLLIGLKVGARGSYSSSDLSTNNLWYLSSPETNGRITLAAGSNGAVTLSSSNLRLNLNNNAYTSNVSATGTMSMDRNGRVTATLTINPGSIFAYTVKLTGQMNSGKNTITLTSADGSAFFVLTNNTDHPVEFVNAGKTVALPNVAANQDVNYTFAQLAEIAGIRDIDGDTLPSTIYIRNTAGTLTVNGVLRNNDEWIAIASGNTVVWNSGATFPTRTTSAFRIATSANPDADETVNFTTRRVANAVNVTASKPTATEPTSENATDGISAQFRITRAITGSQSVVFTVGGSAVYGTDYTVVTSTGVVLTPTDGKFTAQFGNDEKVLLINIVPKAITGKISTDRTVTLVLSTPAANSGYELGSRDDATVRIKGNYTSADTAISVSAYANKTTVVQDSAAQNTATFVISRTSTANGAFTVSPNFSLDPSRIDKVEFSFDNGEWQNKTLSDDVAFLANTRNVRVRYTLKADPGNVFQTSTETFTVAVAEANNDTFYVSPSRSAVVVTVRDTATQISVTRSAGTIAESTGSASRLTVSRGSAVRTDPLIVTFTLTGTATAGDDYTVTGATLNNGTYSVTIPAGAATTSFTIAAKGDTNRSEVTETVIMTVTGNSYLTPTTPTTINITNSSADTAPIVDASLDLGSVVTSGTATITYAQLAEAASDKEGDTITFTITSVPQGVTLTKVNADNSTVAVVAGTTTIAAGEKLTWVAGNAAASNVELFRFKAKSTTLTSTGTGIARIDVTSSEVNAAPTIANAAATLGSVAPSTQKTIAYADIVAATGATDAENDPIIFSITNLPGGITLTKGGQPVTVGTTITEGESLVWAGQAGTGATQLFSVQAGDADNTPAGTTSVVSITVSSNAPTITQSITPQLTAASNTYTLTGAALGGTLQTTNPSGGTLTYKITGVTEGTVEINGQPWDATTNATFTDPTTVTWTRPSAGATTGSPRDILTIEVSDGTTTSDPYTYKVEMLP